MPSTIAFTNSRPDTGRYSATARIDDATGPAGWMTVFRWVSSKSNTWELIPFISDAFRMSIRSRRPSTAACGGPQNGTRAAIATSRVS
jgi:hypothetical protein